MIKLTIKPNYSTFKGNKLRLTIVFSEDLGNFHFLTKNIFIEIFTSPTCIVFLSEYIK